MALITRGERARPGLRRCKGCWMQLSLPSPAAAGTSPARLSTAAPLPEKLGSNLQDSARVSPSSPKSLAFPRPPAPRSHSAARGVLEGREDCQRCPAAGAGLGCGRWTSSSPTCSWPSPPLQPVTPTALHCSPSSLPCCPPDTHGGPPMTSVGPC